jgi:hypothetical protein
MYTLSRSGIGRNRQCLINLTARLSAGTAAKALTRGLAKLRQQLEVDDDHAS